MAAYEDFEFFRTAKWRAAHAPPAKHVAPLTPAATPSATPAATAEPARDALRAELERLGDEVRRLRAHHRVRRHTSWRRQLRKLVAGVLPRARHSRGDAA